MDSGPNRTNKAASSNFSWVVRTLHNINMWLFQLHVKNFLVSISAGSECCIRSSLGDDTGLPRKLP